MTLVHKLKLLSGQLDGVEFTLLPGDTVFHVGSARTLHEGQFAATVANADNVFYIPGDHLPASFRIRCTDDGLRLEVREGDATCWVAHDLPMNEVLHVAGLAMAVRADHEAWSQGVLDHRLPVLGPFHGLDPAPPKAASGSHRGLWILLAVLFVLLAGSGWWLYERQRPAAQVRQLEAVLSQSPYDYTVIHGKEGLLHAFTDSAEALAWGQRASERAGRTRDQYYIRHREAERIGAILESASVEYAVIRLRTPQEPQIVITATGPDDAKRREWVLKLVTPHMPYATRIDVRTVGDAHLVAIARAGLRSRGITTRVGSEAGRTSIGNDAFLDDAALHAMARYRDTFVDEWGARRVHINIRLWDDLLKGRSYQYSDDQLLSIGEGRWEFSTSGSR
jgi:type III secretion system PrgH/EprH family protein